jgi:AcrR family transcriptional regulator
MGQPTRRELQAQERRNQLIDSALTLFAEKGFERTTIKDLSEAARVAQGLIYHYFESKEELLFAAVDKHGFLP